VCADTGLRQALTGKPVDTIRTTGNTAMCLFVLASTKQPHTLACISAIDSSVFIIITALLPLLVLHSLQPCAPSRANSAALVQAVLLLQKDAYVSTASATSVCTVSTTTAVLWR
jgi:hypothetical protein